MSGWYGNSSGSGGGWYGSSSGGKKPKPKKPKGKSVGGFFGNLVDDIQETATSLVPGLVAAGSSVVHDAARPFGLSGGQYQSDDILKSIYKSYTGKGTFWGELGRGLDVALTHPTFSSSTWDKASDHFGRSGGAFYNNPFGPVLDIASLVTMGGGAAAKGASLVGKGADASKLARRVGTAELGYTRKLSANPVIRARQNAFESVAQRLPEGTPVVGTMRRVARHDNRLAKRADARRAAQETNPFRDAVRGLSGVERDAVHVVAGGHKLDDLIDFTVKREAAVAAEIAAKKAAGRKRGNKTLVVDDSGKVRRAKTDEELAYADEGLQGLLKADQMDSLKENLRNLGAIQTRRKRLEKLRDSGVMTNPKRMARVEKAAAAARDLSATTTGRLVEAGVPAEAAATRPLLESAMLQLTGSVDNAYAGATRSHVRAATVKRAKTASNTAPRWTKPGKLDEAQRNTGYNAWNALDDIDPLTYLRSHGNAEQFVRRTERAKLLLSKATRMTPGEAARMEASGAGRILDKSSKLGKDMDLVSRLLDDAADVLGDSDDLAMLREMLDDTLTGQRADGMVPVIPTAYYNELVGEFKKASNVVRILIDNPTRVWRALTLNLRPAWIVNNFVGQMFLLAVAHGVRGIKNYVMQFGRKGKLVDELAPELSDFGWAHEMLQDTAGLGGNKATRGIKRLSDAMGRLNQRLTDDHTRKASFLSTMDPHIKRLQKSDPSLSYEAAAKKLWENEDFADEVTNQVLSDMVDFGDLSDFERRYIKRAIPFYAWISGITKRTARLVADEPWKAAIAYRLSQQGAQNLEDQYGELPKFLKGMVGVGDDKVLMTQGLNPFMTPADVSGMLSGAFLPGRQDGPQNPLAQLNPIMKAPLEALTNRDFFYGREIDREGEQSFARRIFEQGGNSIAQKRVLDEFLQQRQMDNGGLEYDPLFTPSTRNALASYFGVPIRTLDIQAANSRALRDA